MTSESTELAAARQMDTQLRHDWKKDEVEAIYRIPLPELVYRAQTVHRVYHATDRVQTCQLISIKTGGCPEDCAYCPQSAHYEADVERQGLLDPQHVVAVARDAAARGITRMCMGAAWREAPHGRDFDKVLEMVKGVSELGLEVCCTLGMLTEQQAVQLKDAGLTAYNHNLDTSPEFYGSIITTRVYDERLRTLAAVRKAGITVCCGGILGMGEKESDRVGIVAATGHAEAASGERANQYAGTSGGHTAGVDACAGSAGNGSRDCHGQDYYARVARQVGGGTKAIVAGSRDVVLCGGRKFHFCRRKTVDDTESWARRR